MNFKFLDQNKNKYEYIIPHTQFTFVFYLYVLSDYKAMFFEGLLIKIIMIINGKII